MHRPAHRLVAAEGERHVRDAAGDARAGQPLLDPPGRLDERGGVVVVLGDAGRDREDVRVEDDVLGVEAGALGEQVVGALADRDLALDRLRLALLVERHHDHGGAVAADLARPASRNGSSPSLRLIELTIALPWTHFSPASITLHLRGVDHHRHARDLGLGGDQPQERRHRLLAVEQALVHVHVDDLRAGLDLRARDRERGLVVAGEDQRAGSAPSR